MEVIFDYQNYITHEARIGEDYVESYNDNLFFAKRGWCPFCRKPTDKIIENHRISGAVFFEKVWSCRFCGWWEYSFETESTAPGIFEIKIQDLKIKSAILKKYDISADIVPVNILNNFLIENPDSIYKIHYKKMEELVASIFKEHYNCEVFHVGKSYDGGKDVLLVNSDVPTIVQVKRRMSKKKTEPVSSIRELIGATLLSNSKKCIFVTTANRFSKEAHNTVEMALNKSIVDSFELYDFDRFFSIMKLYKKSDTPKPWEYELQLTQKNKT